MIFCLPELITEDERQALLGWIHGGAFSSGSRTVGQALSQIKHNDEITGEQAINQPISRLVMQALRRNETFVSATQARTMNSVLVNRYGPGMFYGAHVDAPIIGSPNAIRSDLSFTLFLADPDSYDGGELVFESGNQEMAFKLPARSLICYPTGQLHWVREVTRGERLAVVGWVQSLIRDPSVRELQYDVLRARNLVRASIGQGDAFDLLNKVHANLMRRYAET